MKKVFKDLKEMNTEALLIIESGLNYYDAEIMQELADRVGLTEVWEAAEWYQEFDDAYAQVILAVYAAIGI